MRNFMVPMHAGLLEVISAGSAEFFCSSQVVSVTELYCILSVS